MGDVELGFAIATFVVSIVTAAFVYLKNPTSGSNVYFGLLIFFISVYPIANYLAVHSSSDAEAFLFTKIVLLFSIPQGPLLYFFSNTFPRTHFIFNKRRQCLVVGWALLNITLVFSGLIFSQVHVQDGIINLVPGPLVFSFGLLHVATIIAGLRALYKRFKKATGNESAQLGLIFYGILVSFSLMLLATFVLPVFLESTILLAVSPVVLGFCVVLVAYAIVAQKLFDIRAAVARSMGYILTLAAVTTLYVAIVVAFTQFTFTGENVLFVHIIYLVGIFVLVVTFHPLKVYFDKVTDKFFFRDSYNTHLLLDELGRIITNDVKLRSLIHSSIELLSRYLKSSFVGVYLLDEEGNIVHKYRHGNSEEEDAAMIVGGLLHHNTGVVETDRLQGKKPKLYKLLTQGDIDLAIRLSTSNKTIGFMIFGYKQNGDIYHKKDLSMLAVTADELAVAVQNALRFEEIQKFNETLQAKVDEATAKLRQSNAKLKALDETKDEFISMASHQLRTPLTSIKGYLSMVLDGDVGEVTPAQRKFIEEAYGSSQRMVYLIGDFLNVSRINTGRFTIELNTTNIANIVNEEVEQLRATALSRQIKLEYVKPSNFPPFQLDETKIRQVVMNFADNAIYYSKTGGRVRLELTKTADSIVFKVKDEGIGVPPHERHHLFTKFYRASNARRARPDGTGIGLFMAKKVILAHGGTVIFETTEGKGSTFGFTLPLENATHR
jgi:signal transduction histidine kinase